VDDGDVTAMLGKEGARKFVVSFGEMPEVVREKGRELVRR
jgi:hypothetical protein